MNFLLTSITTANTLAGSAQSWDLDALGNQLSVTTGSTETDNTTNSQNELTENGSTGLTYDHDGNMTEDQNGTVYVFDAWNRLVAAEPNGVYSEGETYTYNAGGERPGLSMNVCNGTITSSYYSTNWQDLEDDVTSYPCGAQTTKSTYVWSVGYIDDLVERDSSVDGGSVTRIYAQQDANHDITSLVSTSGGVLERFIYEAYGTRTVLTASWSATSDGYSWVYGFQGGRLDPVDGLINFENRDLNPTTGTWMEQDPDHYINGPDLYVFLGDNSLKYLDPQGSEYTAVNASASLVAIGGAMVPVVRSMLAWGIILTMTALFSPARLRSSLARAGVRLDRSALGRPLRWRIQLHQLGSLTYLEGIWLFLD